MHTMAVTVTHTRAYTLARPQGAPLAMPGLPGAGALAGFQAPNPLSAAAAAAAAAAVVGPKQ